MSKLLVGVDLGENPLGVVATPDGEILLRAELPPQVKKYKKRKDRLKLSIKHSQNNSKRQQQKILQVRHLQRKIINCTEEARYRFVNKLTRTAGYIVLENLKPNTFKGQYDFLKLIHRRAAASGAQIIRIEDKYFASSQICHRCNERRVEYVDPHSPEYKTWTCKNCGKEHDRDENAAINIARKGVQQIRERDILPSRLLSNCKTSHLQLLSEPAG